MNDLDSRLDSLTQSIDKTNARVDSLTTAVEKLTQSMATMQADITKIQNSMATKDDLKELEISLKATIRTEATDLGGSIGSLSGMVAAQFDGVNHKLDTLESGRKRFKSQLHALDGRITGLEASQY